MYYVKNLKLAYKINGVKKYKAFVKSYEKEIKSTVDIKQIIQIIIYTYINFLYINY